MRTWQLAAAGAVALAIAGCKTDPEITRLERENFHQQRVIEHQRWHIEDLEDQVNAIGGPCGADASQPAGPQPRTLPDSGMRPGGTAGGTPSTYTPRRPGTHVPEEPAAPPSPGNGPSVKPPSVTLPGEALPEGEVPDRMRVPDRPHAKPTPSPGASARPADSARVAQITLNESRTGTYRGDGRGRDEGISVVIQPRDLAGTLLAAPGDVGIVLADQATPAAAVPVARWDFRAVQTAGMLDYGPGGGIHLDLPWPARPPAHSQLRLIVCYTTRDGRKLQLDRPIDVAMASAESSAWVPVPAGPGIERTESPKDTWRPSQGGGAPPSDAGPVRTASHDSDPAPRRPVWSPDRKN
ncbi:MAG: hypothetical protein ABR915_17135 [Thermoguttaceae bacterium]|jgi:hypothetical protein